MDFKKNFVYEVKEKYIVSNIDKLINDLDYPEQEREKLIKIKKKLIINKNVGVLNVKLTFKNGERAYPKDSLTLSLLSQETRARVSVKCVDIDIINCQPTILFSLCEQYNFKSVHLKNYVENRKEILNQGLSKKDITSIVNGGNDTKGNPFLVELKTEIEKMNNYFCRIETFKKNIIHAKTKKELVNPKNFLYYIVSEIESNFIVGLMKLIEKDYPSVHINNYAYDGFLLQMPQDNSVVVAEILELANKQHQFIKLLNKPIPEYSIEPDQEPENERENTFTDGEREVSEMFLKHLGNDFKFCENTYFIKDNGVWINNKETVKKILTAKAMNMDYHQKETIGEMVRYVKYSCYLTNAEKMVKGVMCFIEETPDFIENLWKSSLGKICWKNGYYDFGTKVFCDNFDNIETTIKIPRDFPERIQTDIDHLTEKFLDPILGELKESFLNVLAQSLAGIQKKEWCVMMGERNSGKTKIFQLCKTAFGNYTVSINADNFVFERLGGGADKAKKLSWATCLEFSRLSFSSEIKMDESGKQKIDGTLCKSLGSGGDELQVRTNYKDERPMKVQATCFILCNDISSATPTDCYETMTPFNLPNKFVDEKDLKSEYSFMKKKDPEIDNLVVDKKYGDALFWVLADHFKKTRKEDFLHQSIVEFKSQFVETDEFKVVDDNIILTRNHRDDFMTNDEIKNFINVKSLNMTALKLKNYLLKRGAKNDTKKIDNKTMRGLAGIKEFVE